jgi:hypothetical protein
MRIILTLLRRFEAPKGLLSRSGPGLKDVRTKAVDVCDDTIFFLPYIFRQPYVHIRIFDGARKILSAAVLIGESPYLSCKQSVVFP